MSRFGTYYGYRNHEGFSVCHEGNGGLRLLNLTPAAAEQHPWTIDAGEWHNPDGSVAEPMEFVLSRRPTEEEMNSTDDDVFLIVD